METRDGTLHFRLTNHRQSANLMNKFHVNVPTASEPRSVAVICAGNTLDQQAISAPAETLTYTVNGRPL
ncbi:Metalloprotease StcE precursor [compost metagenome]